MLAWLMDWNFWVAVITAFAAIAAIWSTRCQLKQSNDQFLYDRRVTAYFRLERMSSTFLSSYNILKGFDGHAADFDFAMLCDNVELEALSGSFELGGELQVLFLKKRDEMKVFSSLLGGMFRDIDVSLGAEFVLLYFEVLDVFRQCYIWLKSTRESNEKMPVWCRETFESMNDALQKIIVDSDYAGKISRMYDIVVSEFWSDMMGGMASKLILK